MLNTHPRHSQGRSLRLLQNLTPGEGLRYVLAHVSDINRRVSKRIRAQLTLVPLPASRPGVGMCKGGGGGGPAWPVSPPTLRVGPRVR